MGTLFKVWFIQDSSLFRVRLRQVFHCISYGYLIKNSIFRNSHFLIEGRPVRKKISFQSFVKFSSVVFEHIIFCRN
jgi:hypothetical protein